MTPLSEAYLKIYNNTALVARAPQSPVPAYPDKITKCFNDIAMLEANTISSLKVSQDGHLVTKPLGERIHYFFFGNKEEDLKLKTFIGKVASCYSKHMITPETDASALTAKTFKKFILGKMASLDSKFFDRSDLFKGLKKEDRKEIQNILSDDVRNMREEVRLVKGLDLELSETLQTRKPVIEHLPATSDLKCRSRMAKASLALRLGVTPSQNAGGATESFIIRDVTGKKLGLYKPMDDSSPNLIRRLGFIVRGLVNINRQVHSCRNEGTLPAIYADIASSVASQHFEVNMTPGSLRIRVKEKKVDGLFLTWCNGFTDASKATFATPPKLNNVELFQKMTAYDYLIGNLDRHAGNWMVNKEGEIRTIDNSNCFLDKNTTDGWSDQNIRKKQYAWKTHPFAGYAITHEVKAFIAEQFTETKIDAYIAATVERLKSQGLDPDIFLTPNVIERLKERGKVLRGFASRDNASPALLGSLYSDAAIANFLPPSGSA
ncbi:MAG: hypothetical protein NTX49_04795 [Chlamydiae bacterium]|nr:hypothetical protein [Chlamydiota bacterium]